MNEQFFEKLDQADKALLVHLSNATFMEGIVTLCIILLLWTLCFLFLNRVLFHVKKHKTSENEEIVIVFYIIGIIILFFVSLFIIGADSPFVKMYDPIGYNLQQIFN